MNPKHAKIAIVVLAVTLLFAAANNTVAQEKKSMIGASDGIREVLTANIGKRVSVKTDGNESLEGTVITVGNQLVHLEKLAGKDFYDAAVRIDRISSVVIRARGN